MQMEYSKMNTIFTDEIEAILQALSERLGQQKYRVWFKNSTKFTLAEEILEIGVPNHFIGSWIESHFLSDICYCVKSVTGREYKITFQIDPALSQSQRKSILDSQAQHVTRANSTSTRRRIRPSAVQPGDNSNHRLSNFVVGSGNELAYNAASSVVNAEKSPFNPLFIHGGYGLGKTHLLQGLCYEYRAKHPGARSLYVSAEDFANQFVLALKTQKLDVFRTKFRNLELLAIDDIHFLASKPSMQEEFLHTFNTIDLAGKQVVLVSDAHPKMIGKLTEKLVNRFVSGMVVKIETPDRNTRVQICNNWAKNMDKDIPADVIDYIAENMRTNVRELEGALLKLVAFASLSKSAVSLAMAQEVLADHISRTDPIVHISDIASAVTTYFGVTTADIYSSKKDRTVSLARSFTMYLSRKYTRMSFPEIGKLLGGKNHATVILACRKVEDLVKRNADIKWIGQSGNRITKAPLALNQLIESIS